MAVQGRPHESSRQFHDNRVVRVEPGRMGIGDVPYPPTYVGIARPLPRDEYQTAGIVDPRSKWRETCNLHRNR